MHAARLGLGSSSCERIYTFAALDTLAMAAAARIAALLAGDEPERSEGLAELKALDDVGDAVACLAPLVTGVLAADVEKVGGAEARRAYHALAGLCSLDPLAIGAEFFRSNLYAPAWNASGSALGVTLAKDPEAWSHADIVLAGCSPLAMWSMFNRSFTDTCTAAGVDEVAAFGHLVANEPFMREADAAKVERMVLRALDLLREPPEGTLPLDLAGAWCLIIMCTMPRPAVGAAAIKGGAFELGMAALRKTGPMTWCGIEGADGLAAGAIFRFFCNPAISMPQGYTETAVIELIIETGAAEACISLLQAFELRGAGGSGLGLGLGSSKAVRAGGNDEPNVMAITHALLLFQQINLTAPEAGPILARLRTIPSALQFALEHNNNINHLAKFGMTTASICAMLCASVFGKEEAEAEAEAEAASSSGSSSGGGVVGGGFCFTEELIEDALHAFWEYQAGAIAQFFEMQPHWLKALQVGAPPPPPPRCCCICPVIMR